jgi:hypothetical protein
MPLLSSGRGAAGSADGGAGHGEGAFTNHSEVALPLSVDVATEVDVARTIGWRAKQALKLLVAAVAAAAAVRVVGGECTMWGACESALPGNWTQSPSANDTRHVAADMHAAAAAVAAGTWLFVVALLLVLTVVARTNAVCWHVTHSILPTAILNCRLFYPWGHNMPRAPPNGIRVCFLSSPTGIILCRFCCPIAF